MDSLKHIDLLIGESLECMVEAVAELKPYEHDDNDKKRIGIGRAICELWEVRDSIYRNRPDLKRDFVKEQEEDKQRYNELDAIYTKAWSSKNAGDTKNAIATYKELLAKSKSGYFTLLAQAGLFRLLKSFET